MFLNGNLKDKMIFIPIMIMVLGFVVWAQDSYSIAYLLFCLFAVWSCAFVFLGIIPLTLKSCQSNGGRHKTIRLVCVPTRKSTHGVSRTTIKRKKPLNEEQLSWLFVAKLSF